MKTAVLAACLAFLSLPAFATHSKGAHYPVHVRGTVTRRGEYRPPHYRTPPNHTQRDNWSAKGNRNPYTGKAGHRRVKR